MEFPNTFYEKSQNKRIQGYFSTNILTLHTFKMFWNTRIKLYGLFYHYKFGISTIINLESLFVCDLNIFHIPRTVNMLKKLSEASKVSTSELYLPDLSTRIFSTSFRPAVNICFIQINNKNMLKTIILPYSYFIFRKKCQ